MILFEKHRSGRTDYLYCQEDTDLDFVPHVHSAYEFICVKKGELLCTVGGREYVLSENKAVLVLPNEIHAYSTKTYSESFLCVFSPDYVDAFRDDTEDFTLEDPVFDFDDFETIDILKNRENKYFVKSALYGIVGRALSSTSLIRRERHGDIFEEKILYYIQENYDKVISLKSAAQALGYNYSYLSRVFNKIFGVGFSALVNEYRLSRAVSLLSNGDYSMMQVCNISGFNSLRNFNNAFLAKYGMSPSDWRKSINK